MLVEGLGMILLTRILVLSKLISIPYPPAVSPNNSVSCWSTSSPLLRKSLSSTNWRLQSVASPMDVEGQCHMHYLFDNIFHIYYIVLEIMDILFVLLLAFAQKSTTFQFNVTSSYNDLMTFNWKDSPEAVVPCMVKRYIEIDEIRKTSFWCSKCCFFHSSVEYLVLYSCVGWFETHCSSSKIWSFWSTGGCASRLDWQYNRAWLATGQQSLRLNEATASAVNCHCIRVELVGGNPHGVSKITLNGQR